MHDALRRPQVEQSEDFALREAERRRRFWDLIAEERRISRARGGLSASSRATQPQLSLFEL